MLQRLREWKEKRRAQSFLENIRAWYEVSRQVSALLGDALYDEKICASEIGVVLDKTDRMLFALGSYTSDARSTLRPKDPALARRLNETSTNIYRLRNAAMRFLIRCQGAGPFTGAGNDSGYLSYYQALEEAGFKARQISREVERELKVVWREMQGWIIQAEQVAA